MYKSFSDLYIFFIVQLFALCNLLCYTKYNKYQKGCCYMCSKVVYVEKNLKKCNSDEKRLMQKYVERLVAKIDELSAEGISFERIFNDSSIKYDIYVNDFYAVKFHGRISMRILYRFSRINAQNYIIEIHMVYLKKSSGKDYISLFNDYAVKNS